MGKIYIVNHSISGGSYVEVHSTYHKSEEDARVEFESSVDSMGEDPCLVELVCLDTETLTSTVIESQEGSIEDYEE